MVTQQLPDATKPQKNQVQETEAKDEAKVVVEEGKVTKDMANEVGASTAQNARNWFGTSGRSRWFRIGLRDHRQSERIQVPIQKI